MLARQTELSYYMNEYYRGKAAARKSLMANRVFEVGKIIRDLLQEVERQEPRFVSTFTKVDGRLEGLEVISPTEFQVSFYLNQMGIFNFVDDGAVPGCAVLKLSEGRKRSMSLWVEFITASGYLSARKVRARFLYLVGQAIDLCNYASCVRLDSVGGQGGDAVLFISNTYKVKVVPAFRCTGIWPRSASHWPDPKSPWPTAEKIAEVRANGFNLVSVQVTSQKSGFAECDAWAMSFTSSEEMLISGGCRRRCLSILKTLRDRYLDFEGTRIKNSHVTTLVLYECEKHPHGEDWTDLHIGDRTGGALLQLVACIRSGGFPHYFLPGVDMLAGADKRVLDKTVEIAWRLARAVLLGAAHLDNITLS